LHRYYIHERNVIVPGSLNPETKKPRRVLITGAGSGIGKATTELFYANGWDVGIANLNEKAIVNLALSLGPRAVAFRLDVSQLDSCSQVVEKFASLGRLDALVNSDGLLEIGMFAESTTPLRQINQIRVNLEGLVNMCYSCILYMTKQGVICSLVSGSAQCGIPNLAVYLATKRNTCIKLMCECLFYT
jgi:NAD(P)-dependent dehydrogenase (short-subunit alcohol dehydrogenase family)